MKIIATSYQVFQNGITYYITRNLTNEEDKNDMWRVSNMVNDKVKDGLTLEEAKYYILSQG